VVNIRLIVLLGILANPKITWANDVQAACKKRGLPVVMLTYRDRDANLRAIEAASLGSSDLAKFLKSAYSPGPLPKSEEKIQELADLGNKKFLPESEIKTLSLEYSSHEKKISDPRGYKKALLDLANKFVTNEHNKIAWFQTLQDPLISSTVIRPADEKDLGEIYGATMRTSPSSDSHYKLEVVFSNNASEPIPYLIPLLIHELSHAQEYKEFVRTANDVKARSEFVIVDEARAFDVQMRTYVSLAQKNPEIFCDWLYATWSYGDLLIPLSWAMASMEEEMRAGRFIYDYAKRGVLKDQPYLLKPDKTALRGDLQKKITDLKLRYVK